MNTISEESLDRADMQRLAGGHDAALNDLMDRHARPVFHFLARLLGNEEDAADLAQETFARVYHARASYDPQRPFKTWLYTIAANLARNQLRWRGRHPNVSLDAPAGDSDLTLADSLPDAGAEPDRQTRMNERAKAVRAAVAQLPPDLRQAIILCEIEDWPLAEAARVLNTTAKAIESRLYRARKILREELSSCLA